MKLVGLFALVCLPTQNLADCDGMGVAPGPVENLK